VGSYVPEAVVADVSRRRRGPVASGDAVPALPGPPSRRRRRSSPIRDPGLLLAFGGSSRHRPRTGVAAAWRLRACRPCLAASRQGHRCSPQLAVAAAG